MKLQLESRLIWKFSNINCAAVVSTIHVEQGEEYSISLTSSMNNCKYVFSDVSVYLGIRIQMNGFYVAFKREMPVTEGATAMGAIGNELSYHFCMKCVKASNSKPI